MLPASPCGHDRCPVRNDDHWSYHDQARPWNRQRWAVARRTGPARAAEALPERSDVVEGDRGQRAGCR